MTLIGKFFNYSFFSASDKEVLDFGLENIKLHSKTKKVYFCDHICEAEKLSSLCTALMRIYSARYGIYYTWTQKQKQFATQYFGSVLLDLATVNKEGFDSTIEQMIETQEDIEDTRVFGPINGYTIKVLDAKSALKDEIDFTDANGITSFDTRTVYIHSEMHIEEQINTLCHELQHTYAEKWGLHYQWTPNYRELTAQTFGTVIQDILIDRKKEFEEIVNSIMK